MKKSLIRKITVIMTTFMLVLSTGQAAFAGVVPPGTGNLADLSVDISKNMTVVNPDLDTVDGPGVIYSYTISPAVPSAENGGTLVTDESGNTGTVQQGPAGGVTLETDSVSFSMGAPLEASSQGTVNTKFFKATSDITKFTSPGIYRYRINETVSPEDITSAGVTDTGDRDRYLDIYIQNSRSGLYAAAYILHDRHNNKTDGFNGASPAGGQHFRGAAEFKTWNIVLSKEVQGNMGDKNNQFPFEMTVNDGGRSFYAKKGELPSPQSDEMISGSGTVLTCTLAHQEDYYISGLSSNATVDYKETNNTQDTYTVSINVGTSNEDIKVAPGEDIRMGATGISDASYVVFTNRLDAVTPTGITMRYGVSIALILAGAMLIILRRTARRCHG